MSLRSQLDALASTFATQIIAVVQGASLQDLAASSGREVSSRGARLAAERTGQANPISVPKRNGKPGRLPRRSADEISKLLGKIVLLVKTHKEGMRAEEIRSKLGMQSKEMPRILKEGIATKKLASKGQKRATTYFVR
jgi:hypothetical protein